MTLFRNAREFAAAIGLLVAIAGCSGGSSSPSSSSVTPAPAPAPSTTTWATQGVVFNAALAAQILASAEFGNADANCTTSCTGGTPTGTQSQAYELHNLHEALSAGLTGAGRLVAVVDSGFRTTHREFAGKTIHQSGALPQTDHGTFVASLIAGNKDGLGMHGVAPGADLHLTAINPLGGLTFDIDNVTVGTLNAAALGAVAQNNSWGFEISAATLQSHLNANPGHSVAQGLNVVVANYGVARWQSYLDALDSFQNGGVVVWSLSNTDTMSSGDVMATLPYFESRLRGRWIAAANGYFEVDGAGEITRAIRLSAPCGLAASFCIVGDGTTSAASAGSDTSYAIGTGTSYVAPQISGAVALLAEAFPDMTAEEWAKRLLASANNSWFGALGVAVSGSVDFGNGVSHAYSAEWGHGVLDIAAALSPIGSVSVLSGSTVMESPRTSLAESVLVTPAAFGDGLVTALAGSEMAVFDSLNRGFTIESSALVRSPVPAMLPEMMSSLRGPSWGVLPSYGAVQSVLGDAGAGRTHIAALSSAAGLFETDAPLLDGRASVFSTVEETLALVSTQQAGALSVTTLGLAGQGRGTDDAAMMGTGIKLALDGEGSRFSLGLSYLGGQDRVLGLGSNAAFGVGQGSATGTVHLGVDQALGAGLEMFGRLEYGMARAMGESSGLVTSLSGLQFSGFEIGARMRDVLSSNDQIAVSLAQPLRVESGAMGLQLPTGRAADGRIEQRGEEVSLAPSGREFNLGLNYSRPLENGHMHLSLQYRMDAGHAVGVTGAGAAIGFRQGF